MVVQSSASASSSNQGAIPSVPPPSYAVHEHERPNFIENGKIVATYDGRPVVELASGRKLVVYETYPSQGKVIAFPYGPWYTFRQAQYWAVAAFSALSATGLGVGLSLYSVTPPGLIAVAVTGVALLVLGVGIGLVRYFNTSDPAAKREAREHALMARDVQSGTLLSPTEARTFAFDSARFTTAESLHSKKSNIDFLARGGLIAEDEQDHLREFSEKHHELEELEKELREKLKPARDLLHFKKRKADEKYERNPVVLINRTAAATAMTTAPTGKKDEDRNSARSALHTGARITELATIPAVIAADQKRFAEKMSADEQYKLDLEKVKKEMKFDDKLKDILEKASGKFGEACALINPADWRFSRSNVDHDFPRTSVSILAALRESSVKRDRLVRNGALAPSVYAPAPPAHAPSAPLAPAAYYVPVAPSAPVYSPLPATAPTVTKA